MKDSKHQLKTSKIIQHRYDNPHDTLQQIGNAFKVSRQYIYKVLKQNNVPSLRAKRMKDARHCKICGELSTKYYNIKVNCHYCRVPFYRKRSQIVQKYNRGYDKMYCSGECYHTERSLYGYKR